MRRYWVVALAVLTLLGVLSPPAFAQAPAPKVSISGFIASYGSAAHNTSQMPGGGASNFDVERPGDHEWSSHTRARFFLTAELGKAKGVLGLELDHAWGQVGATDSVTLQQSTTQKTNSTSAFDLGVDNTGIIEVKQLYVEFPVPLIPFPTTIKVGAVPASATYKTGAYYMTEAAGVDLSMTITPNVKWNFTYIQIDEDWIGNRPRQPDGTCVAAATNAAVSAANNTEGVGCARGDDFAIITSFDVIPMKGLEIRPMYSFAWLNGPQPGLFARPHAIGGLPAVGKGQNEQRHTFGAEARWRSGPWSLQPTVLWQRGAKESSITTFLPAGVPRLQPKAEINAFLIDVDGSYRLGPWLFDARYIYTSGNRPRDRLDKDINFYQPLGTDAAYGADWGDMWGAGQVDNFQGCIYNMCQTVGFERSGRQGFVLGATYAVTPELDLDLTGGPMWTARSVDTDGTRATTGALTPFCDNQACKGDESYLGTDLSFKVVWRFAPGLQARVGFAYLFAGPAFDISELRRDTARTKNDADDAYYGGWMVQYNF